MIIPKRQLNIFLILFLIILFIFLVFIRINKKNYNNIISNENNTKVYIQPEKEILKSTDMIPNKDDCEKKQTQEEKDNCLNRMRDNNAAVNESLRSCLEITDKMVRDKCIYAKVRIKNNKKECYRIADHALQEACLGAMGINKKEISFCNDMLDVPHEYQECVDRIKAFQTEGYDINDCADIKTLEYQNLCIQNKTNNDIRRCDEIKDKQLKDICQSRLLYSYAFTLEKCNEIPDELYRRSCISRLNYPMVDFSEIDSDGDGLSDGKELWFSIDPFNKDSDGDGLSDYDEVIILRSNPASADTDNDGLSDYDEIKKRTNIQVVDSDGDGILDGKDEYPADNDTDGDGLSDKEELKWGTDLNNPDSDGDGNSDGGEVFYDFTDPTGEGWHHDTDGDGLINVDELFYFTDPFNSDTDSDGISDLIEIKNFSNPLGDGDMDFDGDGLSDKEEMDYGTNPDKIDTNDDGIDDFTAIKKGIEAITNDTDHDGLTNIHEDKIGTDKFNPDSDSDGFLDGEEVNDYYTDPKSANDKPVERDMDENN